MTGYAWIVCNACNDPAELAVCSSGLVPAQTAVLLNHERRSPACRGASFRQLWQPGDPATFARIRAYVAGCEAVQRRG